MDKKNYTRIIAIVCIIFVVIWAFSNLNSLRAVTEKLISILIPILAGCSIAFILNIPLRLMERLWIKLFSAKRKRLRRICSLSLCLLLVLGVVGLMVGLIIPQIQKTALNISGKIPEYISDLNSTYDQLAQFLNRFSIALPEFHFDPNMIMDKVNQLISDNSHNIIDTSVGLVTTAFGVVVDSIFALVIAIYILAQKEKLGVGAKRIMYSIFSEKNTERILTFARLSEKTFSGFVLGQLTEACILGALCFVGMLIFRIPYPLLISVIVGITALIPIFGGFIGAGLGAFLILFESPFNAIFFILFIIILQQLEGNLIYPRVVGSQVGLPGLWVLVAVTIGAEFGIIGMLIAVPIVSLIYTVVGQFAAARLKEKGLEDQFSDSMEEKKKKEKKKKKKEKKSNNNVE